MKVLKKFFIVIISIGILGLPACNKNNTENLKDNQTEQPENKKDDYDLTKEEAYSFVLERLNEILKNEKPYTLISNGESSYNDNGVRNDLKRNIEFGINKVEGYFDIKMISQEENYNIKYKTYKSGNSFYYKGTNLETYIVDDKYMKNSFEENLGVADIIEYTEIKDVEEYLKDKWNGASKTDKFVSSLLEVENNNFTLNAKISNDDEYLMLTFEKTNENVLKTIIEMSYKDLEHKIEITIKEGFNEDTYNSIDVSRVVDPVKKMTSYLNLNIPFEFNDGFIYYNDFSFRNAEFGTSIDLLINDMKETLINTNEGYSIDKIYVDKKMTKEYKGEEFLEAGKNIDLYGTLKVDPYYNLIVVQIHGKELNYKFLSSYINDKTYDLSVLYDDGSNYELDYILIDGVKTNNPIHTLKGGHMSLVDIYLKEKTEPLPTASQAYMEFITILNDVLEFDEACTSVLELVEYENDVPTGHTQREEIGYNIGNIGYEIYGNLEKTYYAYRKKTYKSGDTFICKDAESETGATIVDENYIKDKFISGVDMGFSDESLEDFFEQYKSQTEETATTTAEVIDLGDGKYQLKMNFAFENNTRQFIIDYTGEDLLKINCTVYISINNQRLDWTMTVNKGFNEETYNSINVSNIPDPS